VPRHHRGPGERVHPRLRPHLRLPQPRPASASGSTAAPPTTARSSRPTTTRCWSRSPPGPPPSRDHPAHGPRPARVPHPRRGTNLQFLDNLILHPTFRAGEVTTRFIDDTPELFRWPRRDRATKLLRFIGRSGGQRQPRGKRPGPGRCPGTAVLPDVDRRTPARARARPAAEAGRGRLRAWMLEAEAAAADRHHHARRPPVAAGHPHAHGRHVAASPRYRPPRPRQLFSSRCWGGATFDARCASSRRTPSSGWTPCAAVPNILFQMLLRSSNAVGYTNYADNVVRHFVQQARPNTASMFRVFDCLNWVPNMRPAMDAVLETGAFCEAPSATPATCSTLARQVQPDLLRQASPSNCKGRRAHPRHQGHGRHLPPRAPSRRWSRPSRTKSACRCTSTPTTPAGIRRRRS
jgi:hypothetical protein